MSPRSILLIKPGSMGDVILALPVASAIHAAWPDSQITWVVDPRWSPLLEGNCAIFKPHLFPRQQFRGLAGLSRAVRWYIELSELAPDLVIDLQGLLRSGLMAKAAQAKTVVGLRDAREGASLFYSTTVDVRSDEHAVRRYLRCLPALGIAIPEKPEFPFQKINRPQPARLKKGYIVVHPFARGANKSLDAASLNAMFDELTAVASVPIVVVGMGELPAGLDPSIVNLVGQTDLQDLICVLRGSSFVVSVDSGPMHLAAGLGVPLLGIHTWSDPRLVGPYREDAWIWQGGEIRRQDFLRPPLPEQKFTADHAGNVARFAAEQAAQTPRDPKDA